MLNIKLLCVLALWSECGPGAYTPPGCQPDYLISDVPPNEHVTECPPGTHEVYAGCLASAWDSYIDAYLAEIAAANEQADKACDEYNEALYGAAGACWACVGGGSPPWECEANADVAEVLANANYESEMTQIWSALLTSLGTLSDAYDAAVAGCCVRDD